MIEMKQNITELLQKKYDEELNLQKKFVEAGMQKRIQYESITADLKRVARDNTTANLFDEAEKKEFYKAINEVVKTVMGDDFNDEW